MGLLIIKVIKNANMCSKNDFGWGGSESIITASCLQCRLVNLCINVTVTACTETASGGHCGESDSSEKYKLSKENTDRNNAGDGKFTLTVYNPVSNTGKVSI